MTSILSYGYETLKSVPAVLDELRSADNLHRISQIGCVLLHNYGIHLGLGIPVKTHLYFDFKCTAQVIDFLRILRTPSWWLNSVTEDTIVHTDETVEDIEKLLRQANAAKPPLHGTNLVRINYLRTCTGEQGLLRTTIRQSLDNVLAGGKGYTTEGFKEALAKELSKNFSVNKNHDDVQVDLDQLKVRLLPRTLLRTALLVTRTFTVVIVNVALLQEWKLVNFSGIVSKMGLSKVFNSNFPGGVTQSNLIFISLLATYIFKVIDCQNQLFELKATETKPMYGRFVRLDYSEKKKFIAWTALIAAANATLYTFGIFRLKYEVFYYYIGVVKFAELVGDLYYKPKPMKFVESEHNVKRGA